MSEVNISLTNFTSLETLNDNEAVKRLPVTIFIGIISVFGILGNLHVIIIYICKYDHKSTYTIFVVGLAMLDLIGCCVNMPFEMADNILPYTFFDSTACRVFRFSNTTVSVSSLFVLYVIACERYNRICRPMKLQISLFGAKRNVGIAVCLAIAVSWPSAVLNGHRTVKLGYNITGVDCSTNDEFRGTIYPMIHNGLLFIAFIFSTFVLVTLYVIIGKKLRLNRYQRLTMLASNSGRYDVSSSKSSSKSTQSEHEYNSSSKSRVSEQSYKTKNNNSSSVKRVQKRFGISRKAETSYENGNRSSGTEKIINSENKSNTTEQNYNNSVKLSSNLVEELRSENQNGIEVKPLAIISSFGKENHDAQYKAPSDEKTDRRTHKRFASLKSNKVTKILFLITVILLLTYLPHLILVTVISLNKGLDERMGHVGSVIYRIAVRLYYVNNVTNPIIYAFCDKRFRTKCLKLYRY